MNLRLGGSCPRGWSRVAPVLSMRWPFIKYFPTVWVGHKPARNSDIEALRKVQGQFLNYDKLSLVGRDDPVYTTEKDEYLKR